MNFFKNQLSNKLDAGEYLLVGALAGLLALATLVLSTPLWASEKITTLEEAHKAVILLKKSTGSGAGVYIGNNTALSAAHVVELFTREMTVSLYMDPEIHDYGVFEVENPPKVALKVGDSSKLTMDSKMAVLSYLPLTREMVIPWMAQTSFVGRTDRFIALNSYMLEGNSGGALVAWQDGEWKLVGILSAIYYRAAFGNSDMGFRVRVKSQKHGVGFAVAVEEIINMYNRVHYDQEQIMPSREEENEQEPRNRR